MSAGWPAPAKINLFLHVTGRRPDGYHLLQTLFQFVDYGDTLHFTVREDGDIRRLSALAGVAPEQDLVVRAARKLKDLTGCRLGADITVDKRLPMGGGLGGGSSDAATVLVALNQLWGTARVDPSGVQRVNDTLLLGVIRTMWKDSGQVAVIDRNARRVVNSFMRQPAAVIASKAAFPHSVWACVIAPDTAPLIAIAGQYEFEGIGAELSGQVLWRSLTPLAWAGPRGVGERIVAAGYSLDPVCSDSSVMLRMSRTHSDAPVNAPVEPGLVEIRAKNGRLLFSSDDPALGEYLIGAGIAWGKFWAFNDPNSERPRLRVYELVPR